MNYKEYSFTASEITQLEYMPGQSRLNRPQVWDSGSLGSDESRKSFDLYVL